MPGLMESPDRTGSLDRSFFARPVLAVARDLIGVLLLVEGVGGIIVETEAYDRDDPASHAFRGPTPRNAAMFGPPGRAYVYRSYGIHWCLNLVCGAPGTVGSAVLVRALEPTGGLDVMRARRGLERRELLCSGPGRLCQALAIDRRQDGLPLDKPPFQLRSAVSPSLIGTSRRIGLSKGIEAEWRFGVAGSRFLSRPL
jgi:DNA-3-methyladenine glycosylase